MSETIRLFYENNCRRIINEEHIHLLKEPGSEYFGHISVRNGNSKSICNYIISFLAFNSINL